MKYYVYRITNKLNGRFYVGVHSTENFDDGYFGSGKLIKAAIRKYGRDNFEKIILKEFDCKRDAYEYEMTVVETVLQNPLSYNMNAGGHGSWNHVNNFSNRKQPMHDPAIAKKVSTSLKKKYRDDSDYRDNVRRRLLAATEAARKVNSGREFSEKHRSAISQKSKSFWKSGEYRENFHQKTADVYRVTRPDGVIQIVEDLTKFCKKENLPFSTLWTNHRNQGPVKRGRAKGFAVEKVTNRRGQQ